jgi:asparagine synthase (glutamine-hydrolysing)
MVKNSFLKLLINFIFIAAFILLFLKEDAMPGIFGILTLNDNRSLLSVIHSMQTYLTHRNTFTSDEIFHNKNIYAGRCHIGIINILPQPAVVDDIFIWLDGEFYNQDEFPIHGNEIGNDALLLAKNYQADPSLGFMKRVDGVFSAVIYDRPRNKIALCTDRYGFQHLYWIKTKEYVAWASEYKAFIALPGFSPTIDRESLQSFVDFGYIRGNRTWLNDVSLVPPAKIISFDIKNGAMTSSRFWNWGNIQATETKIDFQEIAEEWGRLFKRAVDIRSRPYEKTGIALSGGLDSRAILAAMPEKGQTINAFTYGEKGCDDMRIASKSARIKGACHSFYEIDTPLWLQANLSAVWCTDGEACVLNTHGFEFVEAISKTMSIALNGMGGDPIHGGTLLAIKNDHAFPLQDRYEDEDRRWIRPGFRLVESFYHVRSPFYDNSLIELTMSIHENVRKDSFLYKKILLHNFPDYFRSIPWQKTGVPISYPSFVTKMCSLRTRAKSTMARMAYRHGIPMKDPSHTVNKRGRTVNAPGRAFLSNLFSSNTALYPEFIDKKLVLSTWQQHLRGKDALELINRYATIEIWLQQFFLKTLRPQPDRFPFVQFP